MTDSNNGTGQSPQTAEAVRGTQSTGQETMDNAQTGEPDVGRQDSAIDEGTLPLD
jgi:hypothetical protein